MIKMFNKRTKNQKGFTLIELIVVIAIMGILAGIAVPRFGGFTDKAKIAADEQYAALVGNAAVVLLADDTFKDGGTITIASDSTTALASTDITGFDATEIGKLVNAKNLEYYATMVVTITDDGEHSVTATTLPQ